MPVTGEDDDGRDPDPATPWHQSTAAVFGASLAAVAAIALVVAGVMFVSRQGGEADQAPPEYVEPVFTSVTVSSTTTTEIITSTSPPVTTDIDDPTSTTSTSPSSTSGTPTSGSPTPGSSSTATSPSATTAETVRPPEEPTGEHPTSRKRPRFNITRTLYPVPGN